MKRKIQKHNLALFWLALAILNLQPSTVFAQGTAFTYQGRLNDGANPANGIYDLRFTIYDSTNEPGTVVAGPLTNSAIAVSNGLFTVMLDFGAGVFNGSDRWLAIAVRPGGPGSFTALSPRQKITPTPYATAAGNVTGPINGSLIVSGTITSTQLASGAVTAANIASNSITANQLASGTAAANLNASGQSGVASGGLVLSADVNSSALAAAGYVKIGATALNDGWLASATGGTPAGREYHTAVWTGSQLIVWGGYYSAGGGHYLNDGGIYNPAANSWSALTTNGAPAARIYHTAVWTGSQMLVWGGRNGSGVYLNDGGIYNPAVNSWSPLPTNGAPATRAFHTAVWTGSQMLVWGGYYYDGSDHYLNDGGLYNPAANSWSAVTTVGAPATRAYHTAVWTGSQMIVWGGYYFDGNDHYLNDGGLYNPAVNSWSAVSTSGAPAGRADHTAVWTGSQMIVWGGDNNIGTLNSGGLYNPVGNSWSAVSTSGAPAGRFSHTALWTGSQMAVWGGTGVSFLNDGGLYNPTANSWSAITTNGAPARREKHTAVWTGSQMLVWGGFNNTAFYLNDGGLYNPVGNSWSAVNITISAPGARRYHTAVWTGSQMIVWGGYYNDGSDHYLNDGGLYNPVANSWSIVSTNGAPAARRYHTAVWTGNQMIVWGGFNGTTNLNDGGLYNPVSNSWSAVTITGAPAARYQHTAVWTGSQMIVWGGYNGNTNLNDGGLYNPVGNSWSAVTTNAAPFPRASHTAVWTGSQMIVWGGVFTGLGLFNDGGLYNPASNSWSAISGTVLPGRAGHTAVWTGGQMIIWGGSAGFSGLLNDGGVYTPATDSWSTVSTNGAPAKRANHTAVWTGTQMIVWGGENGSYLNDGGLYNPAANSWSAVSNSGAPGPRTTHTAVWTGSQMIVWGGFNGSYLNDGGLCTPGLVMYLYQKP